jgi:putative oxidoreductase
MHFCSTNFNDMQKKLLTTTDNYSWLILRVALGVVMLGHGLQKAFGWFGGFGWNNTMGYFTGTVGLPAWLSALIILIESLGAVLLIIGLAGRINAALMALVMAGAFFVDHLPNGFFMNWFGTAKGEGYEFDILFWAIGLVITINGSGKYSIDRWITTRTVRADAGKVMNKPAVQ